jgi:uncharacterized membrane protein YhiD involved in acid resistance
MLDEISTFGSDAPLSIPELLLNLIVAVILSMIIRWHFKRFGSTLSNRDEFAQVFPFVSLTVVRFRTPIKEPEELAYLFVSIAVGLGLGASQTVPTVIATLFILGAMAGLKWVRQGDTGRQLFLSLDWEGDQATQKGKLEEINKVIVSHAAKGDLRRYDIREAMLSATYLVDLRDDQSLSGLVDSLREAFPDISITFLDQNHLPSV